MDCLLKLFAICLFDPSAVAFEADIAWQISGEMDYGTYAADGSRHPYNGSFGRVAALVDVPIAQTVRLRYGLEHRSFLETTRDMGEERAVFGVVWRPFAKRRALRRLGNRIRR